jgi:hypothetical protein
LIINISVEHPRATVVWVNPDMVDKLLIVLFEISANIEEVLALVLPELY